MQYRIGDRDPVTGLYDVIWPDGSFTRNGIKIFNSAHEFGDVVLATQRSDGMMILDGAKATLTDVVNTSFTLGGFAEKPVGYLAGQVFNNEEEDLRPKVSILLGVLGANSEYDFDPGNPALIQSSVYVKVRLDRPAQQRLTVFLNGVRPFNQPYFTLIRADGLVRNGELLTVYSNADRLECLILPGEQDAFFLVIINFATAGTYFFSLSIAPRPDYKIIKSPISYTRIVIDGGGGGPGDGGGNT